MKCNRWTVGAIYMALFDWSVINSTIIMSELKEGFTNAHTKHVLVNELIEKINIMSDIPKAVTTQKSSPLYVLRACRTAEIFNVFKQLKISVLLHSRCKEA